MIIAEMSGNHNQSIDRALEIVDAAAGAGVDALKIQTYTPDTMTLDLSEKEFLIQDPGNLWRGRNLYDLYGEAYTPWEWHQAIFERCRERGIIGFSSPFDATAVDFLETLDCPIYKIASFENIDIPLIRKVARTGKPVIISSGMASLDELQDAVDTLKTYGCPDVTLLKCTSTYPASPRNSNLLTIPDMRARFPDCRIGLSDHTMGIGVAVAAIALGAEVLEKHFCLSRVQGGVDSAFSMEPQEMTQLVYEAQRAYDSLGRVTYEPTDEERKSMMFRRSLYFTEDIEPGGVISGSNMRAIRPGLGLPPKYYDDLIGRTVNRMIRKGTPVSLDLINGEKPDAH